MKRVAYFDILNIMACFAVMCLHCNTMVHAYAPGRNWMAALGIEVLFYWAVPIFIMLSGATLMRYRDRYDTKTFMKKRVSRVLFPFLFWSVFFYFLRFFGSDSFGFFDFLNKFFSNQIEGVYWFFFPMISLYLAMPVLSLLADNRRILIYLAGTAFILQSVIPPFAQMLNLPWGGFEQPIASSYFVMYAVIGYLLSTNEVNEGQRRGVYALAFVCLLLRYCYTLYFSGPEVGVDRMLFSYEYFTAVLPAAALFLWAKNHDWSRIEESHAATKALAKISGYSFGVYLIHMPILSIFVFGYLGVPITSIAVRTVGPFLLYGFCLSIVWAIKRIPALSKVVP